MLHTREFSSFAVIFENRKMVKSRETLNQVLSLMTVAFNELSMGLAVGWLAPTYIILRDPKGEFKATLDETSWLACLEFVGEIPGAIFTAFVLDIFGRKILIGSAAFAFFLMWVINGLTNSMLVLCVTRFLFGLFAGLNDGSNSTYLAENSSPKIRGAFGTVCIICYYVGLLTEYAIAAYCSYTVTAIVNAVMTFIFFLSVIWIKEPAQYLLMKGKHEQAKKNFIWLRGGNVNNDEIEYEFERIKENVQSENLKKSSFKKTITSPANYRSLFIVTILYALSGSTGYFPVMSYASMAFSASDILTSNQFTILFGVTQFIVVVSSLFYVERFSRRKIILFSYSLIALCHAITAVLYYVNSSVSEIPYFPWLIFSSISLYSGVYAALYPILFVIRGELFPLSVKASGGCISMVTWAATTTVTTKIFPYISESFGIEGNFLLFLISSVITMVFVYFFLPETKNKTLIEIQEMLEKTK
ncbi:facilitated trehalose transporter Tret1-like isoform X1 [Planococcus citri]|uniref:facilitated trehalose transporter Tret1-like isoform X1 n=1 Tax=Planococcus citri TaxID=170843 RepID=UPI0031FA1139